jgi:ATP-dependent RNA helicase HelY
MDRSSFDHRGDVDSLPTDSVASERAQAFADTLSFAVDPFQQRAFAALDAGASVVVAAPTGSGKTLVAEYAVFLALQSGAKAFYTAPVKALSNQKFADLVSRYGADNIGLLTGDNSVNPDAPVVVMTTEVLRNMIYARSRTLDNLRFVILDEVHYLQDAYRGPVWEEVIIHSPPTVDLVCLSATVSNAEELADWVSSVRGHTEVIIHEERPTELNHIYLVGNRDTGDVTILPTFVDGRPNPQAMKLDAEGAGGGGGGFGKPRTNNRRSSSSTPRRFEIIEALRIDDMLPAIYFIFSRAACTEAAMSCLHAGLRLTAPDERRHIRAIVEERVTGLSDDDLRVLDYGRFLAGLENGYAAHHAGMVPPFKEAVEACFVEGLLKVVFATETLALGINMPARTVVIEKLSKFGGERHSFLTPGEFTQLTGRAGRRGIDPVGYAATLWTPFVPFEQVASLASRRTYELKSAFRPTNNMTVNLVRRYSPTEAHHLLSLSFAQYRIDGDLVSLNVRIDRLRKDLDDSRERALCERGDVSAHIAKQKRQLSPAAPEREIAAILDGLRPGDVLAPNGAIGSRNGAGEELVGDEQGRDSNTSDRGARPGDDWLLVIATARRRGRDTTVRALKANGRMLALTPRDFRSLPNVVTNVKLPVPFNPNSRSFLEAAAISLNKATQRAQGIRPGKRNRNNDNEAAEGLSESSGRKIDRDGIEGCPDFKLHIKALERTRGLNNEINLLQSRITDRKESLSAQFDRVLQLLEGLGYLDGWSITPFGDMLAGIFHESDLLIAECLRSGVLDGLTPPQLAGLISVFVYETRGPGAGSGRRGRAEAAVDRSRRTIAAGRDGRPAASVGTGRPGTRGDHDARRNGDLPLEFPKALQSRYWSMNEIAQELNDDEAALDLPLSKTLDPGFVAVAQRWAGGRELDAVLAEGEITGGDFVRTIKILIDLLRQIGKVSTNMATAKTARQAADALFRGVVKASSLDQLGDIVGSVDMSPESAESTTDVTPIAGPTDELPGAPVTAAEELLNEAVVTRADEVDNAADEPLDDFSGDQRLP